jgi:hypothetical protein
MKHNQDLTVAERLEAVAELLARGIGRLAMERQQRGKSGLAYEKRQRAGAMEALAK